MIVAVAIVGCGKKESVKPSASNLSDSPQPNSEASNPAVSQEFMETKAMAEKGVAPAQFNLGNMYSKGEGVEQDFKEAVKWYHKAAEQGEADAQNNLGIMYQQGEGVPADEATAYSWWNIAAANGDKAASGNKGLIAEDMTPEQITKAEELTKEMIKKNPKLLNKQ